MAALLTQFKDSKARWVLLVRSWVLLLQHSSKTYIWLSSVLKRLSPKGSLLDPPRYAQWWHHKTGFGANYLHFPTFSCCNGPRWQRRNALKQQQVGGNKGTEQSQKGEFGQGKNQEIFFPVPKSRPVSKLEHRAGFEVRTLPRDASCWFQACLCILLVPKLSMQGIVSLQLGFTVR